MITLHNVTSPADSSSFLGLDALSMTIGEGEVVSVLGDSSVARRRLLGVIGLYTDDWSGEYELFGHPVHKLDDGGRAQLRGEVVGAMTRCAPLVDCLSVEENLEIPLSYRGVQVWERHDLIEDALSRLGVASIRDREVDSLPADQLQLVGIAKALVSNPGLVILEEPFRHLNQLQMRLVGREIDRRREGGCIVVECRDRSVAGLTAQRTVDLGILRGARRRRIPGGRLNDVVGIR
jgi:ABC-type lipoprotein export system ATPase subunit